jgi:hypothetical protein
MYFLMDPTLHKILLERRSCDKTVAGVLGKLDLYKFQA